MIWTRLNNILWNQTKKILLLIILFSNTTDANYTMHTFIKLLGLYLLKNNLPFGPIEPVIPGIPGSPVFPINPEFPWFPFIPKSDKNEYFTTS